MAGTVFIFGLGYVGRPLGRRLAAAGWHKKADLHEHLVLDHRAASLFSISKGKIYRMAIQTDGITIKC